MGKKYVDNIAQILCEQLSIVDVVGERVALKKTGKNLKGSCPFHSEKTPSFVVNEEWQGYHCFGCGASGNALNFVMEMENLDFLTAIETLADRYHIDLSPYRTKSDGPTLDRKPYYDANHKAAMRFYRNLQEGGKAKEYFLKRGLSEQTLVRFGLGYAKDSWHDLYHELRDKLPEEILKDCGLFGEGARGYYDRFRDRIIFPIIDLRRRVIGFGARTLDPEGIPKYLNTQDTPVFNKSYHLYGLNLAKDHRGKDKRIYLVEGYMDVISLSDKGIGNAVASLGTAFTVEQAKLLERYCEELILLYDGDEAGIEATKRALEILSAFPYRVRVVNLPEKMDPDDYVQKYGKEEFEAYVEKNAKEAMEYRLLEIESRWDINSLHGRKAYLEEATVLLGSLQQQAQQEIYLQFVSSRLGISVEGLRKDIRVVKEGKPKEKRKLRRSPSPNLFMALLLQDKEIPLKVMLSPWFIYLQDSWKELIAFLVDHEGYDHEKAIDLFSLQQLKYMDKARKLPLSQDDLDNWQVIYHHVVGLELDRSVKALMETNEENALKRIAVLQKKRIELMNQKGE